MIDRRHLLFGASAAGFASALPIATHARADGARARRVLRILRDGSDIGMHSLTATHGPDRFEMRIEIDIRVRLLGITAYRYTHENTEVWEGGALAALMTRTNDDGDEYYANLKRAGDVLEIDGSGYSGTAPLNAAPTSYYARPFIDRRPWISTQSGKPLEIDIATAGASQTFDVTGELTTTLGYNAAGEWVECRFDAGGEPGAYEVVENDGAITPLWQGA
ncbi:MAG: DUF6134 family protein [Pseudomonadota bacterium]